MRNWYALTPKPDHGKTEISIFDEIGMYGISAKNFINDLNRIPADHTITLRIHSPGGEVFDGNAIFNALSRRTADVIVQIEGLAASMATVISLAGNHVKMAANGFYMIHNPWGVAMGDSSELRDQAELLDKIRQNMVGAYAAKSGQSPELIQEWMDAETWFTAAEAHSYGFVDEVTDSLALAASANRFTRLARFRHAPHSLLTPVDTSMEIENEIQSPEQPEVVETVEASVVSESAPEEQPPVVEEVTEQAEPVAEVVEVVEAPAEEVTEEVVEEIVPQARLTAVDSILEKFNAAIAERDAIRAEMSAIKSQLTEERETLARLERSLGLAPARVVPEIENASPESSDPVAEYLAAVESGDRKAAASLFEKHKAAIFAHRNSNHR
jgi:ATP-dependent Clp protease, protease subunit